MSDKNINKMDFKELRNEVQLLRDDIAKWKRLYEDMLYNLDTDNFSSRLVKEKNGMATAIEITAEGLKTKVSQEQLATSLLDYSTITQTATQIELAVVSVNNLTDTKLENYSTVTQTADAIQTEVATLENDIATKYSTVEQTAEAITSTVTAEYVNNLIGGGYVTNAMMMSQIEQSSEEILLAVSTEYETKDDANNVYEQLQADISLTSEQIQLKVSATDLDTKLTNYSTIEQTSAAITNTVNAEYVNTLIGDEYVTSATMNSKIQQSSNQILSTVSTNYETIDDAYAEYDNLWDSISSVSQTANSIKSTVTDVKNQQESIFTQTSYGFTLDGDQTTFTGVIFLTDNDNVKRFSFFYDQSQGTGDTVYMWSCSALQVPVVIGDNDGDVYIGQKVSGSEIATRNWVLANAGSGGGGTATAVFG